MRTPRNARRKGAVLPIVTVLLIGLMAFVALAIDLGVMAVARTQCQAAADISALSGARTLDGKASSSNNNLSVAIDEAKESARSNIVLNQYLTNAEIASVEGGVYRYDPTAQRFQAVFGTAPGVNEAYGVMKVRVTTTQPTYFAKVLGMTSMPVGAEATAVHRPRDVAIVLDFSGSMGYSSEHNYNSGGRRSLNPDDAFPRFGPWSIFNGPNMVMTYPPTGTPPANLNTWVPPTPMQRVWQFVDSGGETHAANNLTVDTANGTAMVNNFLLADNVTSAFVRSGAFPSLPNVRLGTPSYPTQVVTPAPTTFWNQNDPAFVGDKFPLRSGVTVASGVAPTPSQYAQHVADYLGISRGSVTNTTRNVTWETNGYDWDFATNSLKQNSARMQGFTMGPGYYGKTFYMWPPDPRAPAGQIGDGTYVPGDWRRRFFSPRSGSTQDMRDNAVFWDAAGGWQTQSPGTTARYLVNYNNVLAWLKRGPQTLPPSLRGGRVVYYSAIPDTIPVTATTGVIDAGATQDQRFWKDYIDYVIGAGRWNDNNVLYGANAANSNSGVTIGGGVSTTTLTYNNPSNTVLAPRITSRATLLSANGNNAANTPYMRYDDNPLHPRAQFWFGPLTMLCYLQSPGNWVPGTSYEAQCWQLKAGINSAITDIKNNHVNDLASVIFFSGSQGYSTARVEMSKKWNKMQDCLFFPYTVLDTISDANVTVRPYGTTAPTTGNPAGLTDTSDTEIPNSGTATAPEMGFMLAYSELSNATGNGKTYTGRRGAIKFVVFETDGVPNTVFDGTLMAGGGTGPGYYYYNNITNSSYIGQTTSLAHSPKQQARDVVRQICADVNANPPGYSTTRQPARVHALAFGELFEASTISTMKPAALRFLAAVQIDGNTSQAPSPLWKTSRVDDDSLDYNAVYVNKEPWKIITGTYTQRIDKLRQAMERIMQGGVQVALIQ